MKNAIKFALSKLGYELRNAKRSQDRLGCYSESDLRIMRSVADFTMTPKARIACLLDSVNYLIYNEIQGDFVECGVWRGGSAMAIAYRLLEIDESSRQLWLYDTFEGMTAPTPEDVDFQGRSASLLMATQEKEDPSSIWCYSPVAEVQRNLLATGFPGPRIRIVKGDVSNTLQTQTPEKIALLRLDTDFYESTIIELETLYPKLSLGGVLIIDDYGYWKGARRAVDEYFNSNGLTPLLTRIDDSCRLIVKTQQI